MERRPAVRRARLALLGPPGAGKRTLVVELAAQFGGAPVGEVAGETLIALGDGLEAAVTFATFGGADGAAIVEAARRAEALLLAQDLADVTLDQIARVRAALAASGVQAVPRPLPIAIRPRAKGGLTVTGGNDATRDALLRWCRGHQVTHAEVVVRDAIPPEALTPAALALYAEAAWQRAGGARAQQAGTVSFRAALIVGTRYDELDGAAAGAAAAEERLRAAAPGFACVAVSVLDAESLQRLRDALAALVGRTAG